MAVILVKIDTDKNTYTIVHEIIDPKEENLLNIWTVSKVVELCENWFEIKDIKVKNRGKHAHCRIIASVLLEEYFGLPRKEICEILGYSSYKNSRNIIHRNHEAIITNKDVQLYPIYKRLKKVIDGK